MIEPVIKEVVVAAAPDVAFRRFTDGFGGWWPRGTHSVFGDHSAEAWMEVRLGGRLMERSSSGEEAEWGRILAWDPPHELRFTWHPGRHPETAQEVCVTFTAEGAGTRVRLVHTGWEDYGAGAEETRGRYEHGWNPVLERFSDSFEETVAM